MNRPPCVSPLLVPPMALAPRKERRASPSRLALALLLALVVALPLAPSVAHAQEPTREELAEMRAARLGGTLASFEDVYGEAAEVNGDCASEEGCIAIYAVDGYDRIQVLFGKGKALWIQILADRADNAGPDPDPADWAQPEAYELAAEFLPTDTELDPDDAYPNADGDLVSPCHSASLVRGFEAAVYKQFRATGKRGNCQLVFNLNNAGGVGVLNVMLGDGPFPAGLKRPGEPLTAEELEYLDGADTIMTETLSSIGRFRQALAASDANLIADVVVFWQVTLPTLLEESPSRTLEPFSDQYLEAAALLGVAAAVVTAIINGDASRADVLGQNLTAAENQLMNLRDAVAAYRSIGAESAAAEDSGGLDEPLTDEERAYLTEVDDLLEEILGGSALIRAESARSRPDDDAIDAVLQGWPDLVERAEGIDAPSERLAEFHGRFIEAVKGLDTDLRGRVMVLLMAGEIDTLVEELDALELPFRALREEIAGYLGA